MRGIPEPYEPPPDALTPTGLLWWICRRQWRSIAAGTGYDIVWLLGLALTPWAIGRVIDQGIVPQDAAAFGVWIAVVIWLQLQHSLIQGLRDRAGILNWRRGFSRVNQLVTRTVARNGTAAEREIPAGGVVTMAMSDAAAIAFLPIMIGALTASLVAYAVIGWLLLRDSPLLGAIVLVGVPLFSVALLLLAKPLHRRQRAYRSALERMNTVATDSVSGIRVLRGIGGEKRFLQLYRERSAQTRVLGTRVAWPLSAAEALKLVVSGVLVVGLTWIGALLVVRGQLRVGELVAFYGYAGFMVTPVSLVSQAITTGVQARVGAARIVELLDIEPLVPPGPVTAAAPTAATPSNVPGGAGPAVSDAHSGLDVRAGEILGVVSADPARVREIADRLARLVPDEADRPVHLYRARSSTLPLAEVRRRVVVADAVPYLFSGTLRALLDPYERRSERALREALEAADARDVLDGAADGFATAVGERGVQFSGGQRQRLGVARALLTDAEVLVLLEPTSSVDAATEARMAAGIRAARARQTTIIATVSPLVLTETDRVAVLSDGVVDRYGTHHELVHADPHYRALVMRGEGLT